MAKITKIVAPDGKPFKLDLACGNHKAEGHIGIDLFKTDAADYTFDLLKYPWPVDDEIVDGIHCAHFFEHIPGRLRPKFIDECYRILKPKAQMTIIVPHWSSMRSVQDYSHEWPPVAETSFLYFNKKWREDNKLTHGVYNLKCDFDFGYGFALDGDVSVRNHDFQHFAIKHYNNAVLDLIVTMTKRQA